MLITFVKVVMSESGYFVKSNLSLITIMTVKWFYTYLIEKNGFIRTYCHILVLSHHITHTACET